MSHFARGRCARHPSTEQAAVNICVCMCVAAFRRAQTVLFGVLAAKFASPPHNRLVFSTRLACFSRDGAPALSFRVAHPQGHLVTNLVATMLWVHAAHTREGAPLMRYTPLEVGAIDDVASEDRLPLQ